MCKGALGLSWKLSSKESACHCRRQGLEPWVGKIPWRRKWEPTSVFLPGKSHGQRSLAGCSSWGHKESDTAEQLTHSDPDLPQTGRYFMQIWEGDWPEGILCLRRVCICPVLCMCTQSCPTLCDPVDCSPPGSSVHGISQARILEWVAFPFPVDLPNLEICVSYIGRWVLYQLSHWGS